MGNCIRSPKGRGKVLAGKLHTYPRHSSATIKQVNSLGKKIDEYHISYRLPEPLLAVSQQQEFGRNRCQVSLCVLPGFDPRGEISKECQDLCFVSKTPGSLLLTLYDGHGSSGQKVVTFCKKESQQYFRKNHDQVTPTQLLVDLTHHLNNTLVASSIESTNSGTTEVLTYLVDNKLYCASVGDSRAVLATLKPPAVQLVRSSSLGDEKKVLSQMKARNSSVAEPVKAVQLTQDQKPNDPEEFARITKAGGRVQRLTDNMGNKVGPYRVWELTANTPGLAMSRSIGDSAGAKLGVISTPITTEYVLNPEHDYFLVIASDGIWDVMDNDEVVSFVQHHRDNCVRSCKSPVKGEVISSVNSCVAQLLCEEARHRWRAIVEEEDVLVDDISCVVVEFLELAASESAESAECVEPEEPVECEEPDAPEFKRSPTLNEVNLRDPRRGSVVLD